MGFRRRCSRCGKANTDTESTVCFVCQRKEYEGGQSGVVRVPVVQGVVEPSAVILAEPGESIEVKLCSRGCGRPRALGSFSYCKECNTERIRDWRKSKGERKAEGG